MLADGFVRWDVAMVAVVEVVVVADLAFYFHHSIQALVEPFRLLLCSNIDFSALSGS